MSVWERRNSFIEAGEVLGNTPPIQGVQSWQDQALPRMPPLVTSMEVAELGHWEYI